MNLSLSSLAAHWPWTTTDVLTHLWQSTVVAGAVLIVLALSHQLSARTRRTLGWLALIKFALPASVLVHAFARFGATPARWIETSAISRPIMLPAFVVTAPANNAAHLPVAVVVTALWLGGFAALFASWLLRGVMLRRRILAESAPVDAAMEKQITHAADRAGLSAAPRCLAVGSERGPAVLGIFAPVVIVPRGLAATLASAEFEAVLIHEFVHLRRRDNFWSAVQTLLVSLFWFHPLVWILNRRLAIETEQSCDERVLEITGDPETYADGILKSVQHALGVAQPGLAGATTPPIVERIKNIFARGTRRDRPMARVAVLTTGVVALGLSGYAGSFAAQSLTPAASEPKAEPAVPASPAAPTPQTPTPSKPPRSSEATLSIDFPDEDIRNVLRNVADLFALNIVMPETLKGRTSAKLRDVTWRQIYHIVLAPVGYTFVEEGNVVRIVSNDRAAAEREQFTEKEKLAVDYLAKQSERLQREAEAAKRKLADYKAAQGEQASSEQAQALKREAEQAAKNKALVDMRLKEVEAAAVAADTARLAAIAAEREAATQKKRMAEEQAQQQNMISLDVVNERLKSSNQKMLLTGEIVPLSATVEPSGPPPAASAETAAPTEYRGAPVYDISKLDRTPAPRSQARPDYPLALRKQNIGGEAVVDFIVDTHGDVVNARAVNSTHPEFATSAVTAVSKWKFRPGRKDGRDVNTHMQVPIIFTLNEN